VLISTAKGQLQSHHEYKKQQQYDNTGQNKKERESYNLKLFTIKHELLKISVSFQTAFAAETHLAEGQ
jgi:hypothetical protein